MKQFANLYQALENTSDPATKKASLIEYLPRVSESDQMWAIALLLGRRPRRVTSTATLKEWAIERSHISPWLFEESLQVVGELAETIALILPAARYPSRKSLSQWMTFLYTLEELNTFQRKESLLAAWDEQEQAERLLFIKLLTGSFRSPLSNLLITQALAEMCGTEATRLAHRLSGNWHPHETSLAALLSDAGCSSAFSQPYPFHLAHHLEDSSWQLGQEQDWQAEWKWDGIRVQLVKRNDELFVWSRGEELVTDKFPELLPLKQRLPNGTVIDGEIIPFADGQPLPFGVLQSRLTRKTISVKAAKESPVVLIAYDLLEWEGTDIRKAPLTERRDYLETLVDSLREEALLYSDPLAFSSWQEVDAWHTQARENFAEGIMFKRKNAPYQVGRRRGDWWKWKANPFTLDGVLLYAQKGQDQRLFTDFTFGVWDDNQLIPFAKVKSELSPEEAAAVDLFIQQHTVEKFGPVRTVQAALVFEVSFEGVEQSSRHKAGLSVRAPRLLRWRLDKPAEEASTLADLRGLLNLMPSASV